MYLIKIIIFAETTAKMLTKEELQQKLDNDPEFREAFFRTREKLFSLCEEVDKITQQQKKRVIAGKPPVSPIKETIEEAKESIGDSIKKGAEKTKDTFVAILGLAFCAVVCFIFINLGYALFAIIAAVLGLIIGFFGMFSGVR